MKQVIISFGILLVMIFPLFAQGVAHSVITPVIFPSNGAPPEGTVTFWSFLKDSSSSWAVSDTIIDGDTIPPNMYKIYYDPPTIPDTFAVVWVECTSFHRFSWDPGDSFFVYVVTTASPGDTFFTSCILNTANPQVLDTLELDVNEARTYPGRFYLTSNYPNPFNPATSISFGIGGDTPVSVRLDIYNLLGDKIKTVIDKELPPGSYEVTWDGMDKYGNPVASGVYFYRLKAGGNLLSRKMLLLR